MSLPGSARLMPGRKSWKINTNLKKRKPMACRNVIEIQKQWSVFKLRGISTNEQQKESWDAVGMMWKTSCTTDLSNQQSMNRWSPTWYIDTGIAGSNMVKTATIYWHEVVLIKYKWKNLNVVRLHASNYIHTNSIKQLTSSRNGASKE